MYARSSRSANRDTNSWRSFSLRLCQCGPSARLAVSSKSKILSASLRMDVLRSLILGSDFRAGSSSMRMTWSTDVLSWSVGSPAQACGQDKSHNPKPRKTDRYPAFPNEHVLSTLTLPRDRSLIPCWPPGSPLVHYPPEHSSPLQLVCPWTPLGRRRVATERRSDEGKVYGQLFRIKEMRGRSQTGPGSLAYPREPALPVRDISLNQQQGGCQAQRTLIGQRGVVRDEQNLPRRSVRLT